MGLQNRKQKICGTSNIGIGNLMRIEQQKRKERGTWKQVQKEVDFSKNLSSLNKFRDERKQNRTKTIAEK